jgi:hypothetical protein
MIRVLLPAIKEGAAPYFGYEPGVTPCFSYDVVEAGVAIWYIVN